jgi:hypothetical protein
VKYLWPISARNDPNERVTATIRAYTEVTSTLPNHPLADEDRRQVRDWLIHEEMIAPTNEDGYSAALLVGEHTSDVRWLRKSHPFRQGPICTDRPRLRLACA